MSLSKQSISVFIIAGGVLFSSIGQIISYSVNPPIPTFVLDGGAFTTPKEDAETEREQNTRVAWSKGAIYMTVFGILVLLAGTVWQVALRLREKSRRQNYELEGKDELSRRDLVLRGLLISSFSLLFFIWLFKDRAAWVSPYLLFLTLLAILWYSLETRGLKNQMIRQNELSLRPRLIFIKNAAGNLRVTNIGNGAALKISIEDYVHELPGPGERFFVYYRFECQNILEPDEYGELIIKTGDGKEYSDAISAELAQLVRHTFELTLKYENVLGQEYVDKSVLGIGMLKRETFRR